MEIGLSGVENAILRRTVPLAVFVFWLITGCSEIGPGQRSGPEILWQKTGWVSTQPVIAGNLLVAGFKDGLVVAYDRHTGDVAWQRQLRAIIRIERLLLVGDVVIVPGVILYGLDAQSGVVRWEHAGLDEAAGIKPPGISGDTLFVAGFTGGEATALNAATGEEIWSVALGKVVFTPTVTDSLVVFPLRSPDHPGELVAVERRSGEVRWRRPMPDSAGFQGGGIDAGAQFDDRLVLGTSLSTVLAVRLADGEIIWEHVSGTPQTDPYVGRATRSGNQAILQRGDGLLESRNPADGAVLWTLKFGAALANGAQLCAPHLCRADGRVYIVSTSGQELWSFGGGNEAVFLSDVTVADDGLMYAGVVYGLNDTRLIAFRPPVSVGATP